jgi:hypothetical protein
MRRDKDIHEECQSCASYMYGQCKGSIYPFTDDNCEVHCEDICWEESW